jgi:hypothetical protein
MEKDDEDDNEYLYNLMFIGVVVVVVIGTYMIYLD